MRVRVQPPNENNSGSLSAKPIRQPRCSRGAFPAGHRVGAGVGSIEAQSVLCSIRPARQRRPSSSGFSPVGFRRFLTVIVGAAMSRFRQYTDRGKRRALLLRHRQLLQCSLARRTRTETCNSVSAPYAEVMKLTTTNGKNVRTRRHLPRPTGRPDSFTLRQLDEAMKWLRETKRERRLTHAPFPAR